MVVLVDMDGTLANLTRKWFRVLHDEFEDDLDPDEAAPVWDVDRISRGGSAVYAVLRRPGFFRDLEPYPGAVEALRQVHVAGHEIIIVTDADGHNFADKRAWVQEHLPFVPMGNFVATARKELIDGDLIVDDAPHVLEACLLRGRRVLAMDRPYNRHVNCQRAHNWAEVLEVVDALACLHGRNARQAAIRAGR